MGKKDLKGEKRPAKLKSERLFMRNGSTFTFYYETKRPAGPENARTEYVGAGGVFLGDVLEAEIAARISMDIPAVQEKAPGTGITFPAGCAKATGYVF